MAVAAGGSCGSDDRSGTLNLIVADIDNPAAVSHSARSPATRRCAERERELGRLGRQPHDHRATALGKTGTAALIVTVSDGAKTGTVTVTITIKAGGNSNDTLTGAAQLRDGPVGQR